MPCGLIVVWMLGLWRVWLGDCLVGSRLVVVYLPAYMLYWWVEGLEMEFGMGGRGICGGVDGFRGA